MDVATLDEEKSSSLIFFTRNERGMFQWVKTRRREKHMREETPLRKHADGRAGFDGKSLFSPTGGGREEEEEASAAPQKKKKKSKKKKKHRMRKKMETGGERG